MMTNPQLPAGAILAGAPGTGGQDQGGRINDPVGGDGGKGGGGTGGSEREPLPHHRDLPGQEIPEQDPDLEPIIGDEDGTADISPAEDPQGGRSMPV
jgi:hypothetical protein